MKMARFFLAWASVVVGVGLATAGVTWVVDVGPLVDGKRVSEYTAAVVSTENVAQVGTIAVGSGYVTRVVTVPGLTTNAPLAAYDCEVRGAYGEALAPMADRINTMTQTGPPITTGGVAWYPPVYGSMGMWCANMGTGTTVSVKVYVQQ
jgi:hypothetical protein